MRRSTIAMLAAAVLLGSGPALGQAKPAPGAPTSIYLVQMRGAPVSSYTGTIDGYAATKPSAGA
ncbi:MAG TPA: hypothetical protein VFE14_03125, partial [Micromonosporaceae bacterium]|nr:hypothetical protein [Micromonosporaceae bacterium]